jgi:hypothetical protein
MSITRFEHVEATTFKHDADEGQRADFVVNNENVPFHHNLIPTG